MSAVHHVPGRKGTVRLPLSISALVLTHLLAISIRPDGVVQLQGQPRLRLADDEDLRRKEEEKRRALKSSRVCVRWVGGVAGDMRTDLKVRACFKVDGFVQRQHSAAGRGREHKQDRDSV